MGCFDVTCMASNLSISHGEPVAALILIEGRPWGRGGRDRNFYPCEQWAGFGMPFFGTYNDYGGLDRVEETSSALLTLKVLSALSGTDLTLDNFDHGEILIGRQGIKVNSRSVSVMYMHRAMWDYFTEKMPYDEYDAEKNDTLYSLEKRFLTKTAAKYKSDKELFSEIKFRERIQSIAEMNLDNALRGAEGESIIGGREILEADETMFIEEYSRTLALRMAFFIHRRIFMPTTYVGEQHTPPKRFDGYIKTMKDIITHKKRNR